MDIHRSPGMNDVAATIQPLQFSFDHRLSDAEIKTAETHFNARAVSHQKVGKVWVLYMRPYTQPDYDTPANSEEGE